MALFGVVESEIESALRQSKRLCGDRGPRLIQSHHRMFEAASLGASKQLTGRHAAFLEVSFVDRYASDSHEVFAFADFKTGCSALDNKSGHSTGPALGIHGGEHREQICSARIGGPLLVAVDNVIIGVAHGLGPEAASIRACFLF